MDKAIVIGTWGGGEKWANQCLMSIVGVPYPVVVVINEAEKANPKWLEHLRKYCADVLLIPGPTRYEMGAIEEFYNKHPETEEFWFIQDSSVVKNIDIFLVAFEELRGKSVSYGYNTFECYTGKWRREILEIMQPMPQVRNKPDAIHWEHQYAAEYWTYENGDIPCFDWQWKDDNPKNEVVEILGELRMKQFGIYLDKYKSVERTGGNIPDSWTEEDYQGFLDSWRRK